MPTNIEYYGEKKKIIFYNKKGIDKGDIEVDYSIQQVSNDFLLYNFGLISDKISNDSTNAVFTVQKPYMTKEKHDLIVVNNYLDSDLKSFTLLGSNIRSKNITFKIFSNLLNDRFLKFLRIYYYNDSLKNTNENSKFSLLDQKLINNQWLNFENEIKALTAYKHTIIKNLINSAKLNLKDIIQALILTKKYFTSLKSDYANSYSNTSKEYNEEEFEELTFKYNLRRKVLKLCKNNIIIMYKNLELVDVQIQDVVSDQLVKLKEHYLK